MALYKCTKCGMEALSKCIKCRSIFPTGDAGSLEAVMSNLMKRKVEPLGQGRKGKKVTIEFLFYGSDYENRDNELLIAEAVQWLNPNDYQKQAIKYWICDHDYKITKGQCLFGCCEAENS